MSTDPHLHHGHDHAHDHGDAHAPIEHDHNVRAESRLLEQALRELLIEKNVFSAQDIQRQIELTESRNPGVGARVVARAWVNPGFKRALLEEPKAALRAEFDLDMSNTPELEVVENTPERHYMIVCTLCSCYPRAVLGVPPAWYKSREYRARAVIEPRAVLAEFGTAVPDDVEVRVVDSTADLRYMVLPMRPAGTEAMTEQQLAELVTRDSMIGVARAKQP
jgi:nitrile hydratase